MPLNFINFHILISHSPSCLNRDDMNMQKNAVFGGKRRVRISSQSLKRAMRKSDYYLEHFGNPSTRTREIGDFRKIVSSKLGEKYPHEIIDNAITFWSDARGLNDFSSSETAVAPWLIQEVDVLCAELSQNEQLAKICDAFIAIKGNGDSDKKKKRVQTSKAIKLLQKEERWDAVLNASSNAIDIAFSGRMATSGLMTKVDGALAVAHAITTHEVNDSDIDWFTAVDDLQELGSGHLDTQEFSSGVFYRYASLNIGQLLENMGGASRDQALEIAAHTLHMLATVVPSAKQQSFAAHNLADLTMVSFSDLPVSLANAFEMPVRAKDGFLKPSLIGLNGYWEKVHRGYGLEEKCAEFSLDDELKFPADIQKQTSLEAMKTWIRNDGA